ncbi:tRNA-dihydrouridine synthase family protein [Bacteroides salyersiae]|uniref:tRNA-dihydrouridine synthase family protein n=1 Tax=Bacteroides salyersiae TaxID=291644 RepID=UPI0018999873|nr:tRNA-dihydrouridine synthase family protein [Bacteroides salyersiae]
MPEILPIYFAPLQGYTEAVYRNAHAAIFGGIKSYYTPFLRFERGVFRNKDIRDIEPENNEISQLVPQLIGHEKEKVEAILSLFIKKGYKEVDINMGCPFPILAKRHNGSGILPFPEEVEKLLGIVHKYPEIDFSVKMRLGWENTNECLNLLPIMNALPLKHITMHPRLGKQQYKGNVDMEEFAAFAKACRHPLIYNGDIKNAEDIERIHSRFPSLAGIMIGRGLLANPALAIEYKEKKHLSAEDMKEKLFAAHKIVLAGYEKRLQGGEDQLLNKMKTFWEYLEPQIGHKVWKAIHKSTNLTKYNAAIGLI